MDTAVKEAIQLYESDRSHWQRIYTEAREDARFLSAEPGCQWISKAYNSRVREGRSTLQIDHTAQLINAVVNQIRMRTPSIKVIPGDGTDQETAEIFQDFIRAIQYKSDADSAYDLAAQCAVRMSIGFIRVDREYASDMDFNQRLCIKRVINPLAVYLDANSVSVDGSDAMHATILDEMTVEAFKQEYPGENPISFEAGSPQRQENDTIVIAEQFRVIQEEREIGMTVNGVIEFVVDGMEYIQRRKVKKRKVMHTKMSGAGMLTDETVFPGKYVPIVPVYGEEFWNEGKRHLVSLVRRGKDAQRLYNYWKSIEADVLDNQPQSPFIAALGATEGLETDYKNPGKAPVIRYNAYDPMGKPLPRPQREAPPQVSPGLFQASQVSLSDIKSTIGVHYAALEVQSNEMSGVAIAQRTQQTDALTYHFADNLSKSVAHVGKVIVSATADLYDTPQVVRLVTREEESNEIGINGMRVEGQERDYYLSQGQFDVRVVTSLPYTTRRAETTAFLGDLVRSNPDLTPIIADKLFESMDMAGAEVLAKRMKIALPPQFKTEGENPELVMLQQENAQLKQAVVELQQGEQAKMQIDAAKQETERMKVQADLAESQSNLEIAKMDAQVKMAELQIKQQELEIKRFELQSNIAISASPMPSGIV